ncbi:hypothetical protein GCM10008018_66310 [Paenibacillus marchantiophytorum]|uniref:Uncharacterized protein n=1 Tax=Paenibacillus marchantiophytorum TaxID=1619310 RepID=A0ABQ1FIG4_9BACL|nr:hypothetical protein [Paenibacillus marchantiophytorum]GGA11985.1 hypothetical protein GCM10008018_66310 [Paenibacillus marchantiophytorum]
MYDDITCLHVLYNTRLPCGRFANIKFRLSLCDEATDALYVTHEQIVAGGVLKFRMTDAPTSKTYAHADLPYSLSSMND